MTAFWIALALILAAAAFFVIRQRRQAKADRESRDARVARERARTTAAASDDLPPGMTRSASGRRYDTLDQEREARERRERDRYREDRGDTVIYDDGGIGDLATIAAIEAMTNNPDQGQPSSAAEPPPVPDIPVTPAYDPPAPAPDPSPSYDSGYSGSSDTGSSSSYSSDSGSSGSSDGGGGGGGD